MNFYLVFILVGWLLIGAGLYFWPIPTPRNSAFTTIWRETNDWSITDNDTKKTNAIELGFRSDGLIAWRKGREGTPK